MPLLLKVRQTLGCALAVALATAASAQSTHRVTAGPQQRATGALPGDQTAPQAAVGPAGGYVVWQDNSLNTNGLRIRCQRLGSGLMPLGLPFVVSANPNSKLTFDQEKPQVVLLADGAAAFFWQGGKGGAQKIYARVVGTNGMFVTGDVQVNSFRKNYQITPAASKLSDGTMVVVWASYGQDGSKFGVYGQRLSARGSKLGREFAVNQTTLYNQRSPTVAGLSDGSFVVAWVSELQRGQTSVELYARIFDAAGLPLTGEFPLNPDNTRICASPVLVASPSSGFAVAWSQLDQETLARAGSVSGTQASRSSNGWDVFGRIYDSAGAATGDSFRINSNTYGDQFAPKIAASGNGYFVVWTSLAQDGSREGVFGQYLATSGELEGAELLVNETTISRQIQPTVTSFGDSRFLTMWTSFGAGTSFDLFERVFQETNEP